MRSIIPDHPGGALSVWPAPEDRHAELDERHSRLQALDPEQLPLALEFLIGYHPRVFDAILEAVEPDSMPSEPAEAGEWEPVCLRCGDPVGIFAAHGTEYLHYHGVLTATTKPRPYQADHKPIVGWRRASDTPPLRAVR